MLQIFNASKAQTGGRHRLPVVAALCAGAILASGCTKGNNTGAGGTTAGGGTAGGHGNPEKPGPPQKILLVWNPGTHQWKVNLNGTGPQNPSNAHTPLARNTVGPTMFEVSVDGGGSTPPPLKADSLSVWEGQGQKGSPQQGIHSTQILGPVLKEDGKLVFWDLNQGDPVTLNYQFKFDGGIPPVDPIIENGGHD